MTHRARFQTLALLVTLAATASFAVLPAGAGMTEKDFGYWFEKGLGAAAYGSHKSAATYFQKAAALDPRNPDAYFEMGVCYGEMGEYHRAISEINRAMALGSAAGTYLYGRGLVYLLAGYSIHALEDFKQAAVAGNRDARNYLERRGIDWKSLVPRTPGP